LFNVDLYRYPPSWGCDGTQRVPYFGPKQMRAAGMAARIVRL
jgi:hypothetical protein